MDTTAFKKTFFDKKSVADKIPPAIKKALSKFGAFVRRRAKSSLKYGDKSSAPGSPPTVHRSKGFTRRKKSKGKVIQQPASPFRELIFFGYDASRKSVVVGPALGGSKSGAPEALEHGGTSVIVRDGKRAVAHYEPRPTMQPAYNAELGKAGGTFKNLIR